MLQAIVVLSTKALLLQKQGNILIAKKQHITVYLDYLMQNTSSSQAKSNVLPERIDYRRYTSLIHFMEEKFSMYGDLVMFENMGTTLTYRQVDQLSRNFCSYLQQYTDLKVGDRIALQLPNILPYPIALLGALRAGLIVVNTNPNYTPYEMTLQFKDASLDAIVVLENFAYKLESVLKESHIKNIIIVRVGDMMGFTKRNFVNFIVKHIRRLIPKYNLPNPVFFREAIKMGSKIAYQKVDLQATDTAFLQYTGGTTGSLKAAILTHQNMIANIQQLSPVVTHYLRTKQERILMPLPCYHIFGLGSIFSMAAIGSKMLFIADPRDTSSLLHLLQVHKPTCIMGVQTLFEKLLKHKRFKKIDFSSLKLTVSGGISVHSKIKDQWTKSTNGAFIEGYGLTECSPVVTVQMSNMCHMPLPNTSIIIADNDGNPVPCGHMGEILVKGPQVFKGYLNQETATEHAFINGWFKTGDIAKMNQDGCIQILDRKKDMINISGFNVYPNEIEQVLVKHPKVLDASVIGISDLSFKESIKAFIVKKDATLTAEEIIKFCQEKLTKYKIPKYIEFRNSLPKSALGKTLRRLLKD